MSKLFDQKTNVINSITTKDAYDYKGILQRLRVEATKATTATMMVKPDITTRQEAQDEADRLSQINQAVLLINEGFKDNLCKAGGIDALSSVLQQPNRQNKSIDDYMLYNLREARITGAHRPKATHILKQTAGTITLQFDFCTKVMDNMALRKIMVTKVQAFGVNIDVLLLVVNLEAYTQSHKWGHEFWVSGQAIRKKYPNYSQKHSQKLYNNMVKENAAADRVRVLCEAPAPSNEQATMSERSAGK